MSGGKFIALLVALLLVVGAAWWWTSDRGVAVKASHDRSEQPAAEENAAEGLLEGMPAALRAADLEQARKMFQSLYPGTAPDRLDLLSVAGELALAENEYARAVACFQEIPTSHPRYGLAARLLEGTVRIDLHQAAAAEASLREYLIAVRKQEQFKINDVIGAYKWLNYLLSVELRLDERAESLGALHRIGLADILDSKQLFFPNLLILNSPAGRKRIEEFLQQDPENLRLRIAKVRYQTLAGEFDLAIAQGEQLLRQEPTNRELLAVVLEALFEGAAEDRFRTLAAELPAPAADDPSLLTRFRGEYALLEGKFDEAIARFQEVLARDPAHAPVQMSLATALQQAGRRDEHAQALKRASILAEIRVNLNNVQNDAVAATEDLVKKCEEIDYSLAATVFQSHAKVIAQSLQNQGASPAEGAVTPLESTPSPESSRPPESTAAPSEGER